MSIPRLSSDYATLNDKGRAIGTVTLLSGQSIAAFSTFSTNTDVELSGQGAMRLLITSSKDTTNTYSASRFRSTRTWSLGALDVIIVVFRLDPATVRINLSAFNSYGSTITAPAGNEVFTVSIANIGMPY